ncbi:MAG: hypothetical protein WBF67_06155, partial [Olleya sp.]
MIINKLFFRLHQKLIRFGYASVTNNMNISGVFKSHSPVVVRGFGKVQFGDNVNFGVINSPKFYNSYAYIEARNK